MLLSAEKWMLDILYSQTFTKMTCTEKAPALAQFAYVIDANPQVKLLLLRHW